MSRIPGICPDCNGTGKCRSPLPQFPDEYECPLCGGSGKLDWENYGMSDKHIVAESITIKSPDGKGSISLTVTQDGPGIWLTSPSGKRMIGIHALEMGSGDQVCVWIGRVNASGGHDFAVSIDANGRTLLQYRDKDGETKITELPEK